MGELPAFNHGFILVEIIRPSIISNQRFDFRVGVGVDSCNNGLTRNGPHLHLEGQTAMAGTLLYYIVLALYGGIRCCDDGHNDIILVRNDKSPSIQLPGGGRGGALFELYLR